MTKSKKDNVKKFILLDLTIGLIIAGTMWNSLGAEGMAAKFCDSIHVERCDEIEWSEEYAAETSDVEQ